MKKLSLAILIVGGAVLAFVVGLQRRQIAELRQAVAEEPAVVKTAQHVPAPTSIPHREVAVETKRAESTAAPAAAAPLKPATPAAVAENKREPTIADFFANVSTMMTNPVMKQMVREQSKIQLAMQYDRLFKFFDKPESTIDALKEILMDRQMALMDSSMAFMSGNATPEERKQKAKELQTVNELYDQRIEQLLGSADYDAFKQYEATQPERIQVEMFKNSMASSGEPLTDQQEYDLVNAMYQVRTNSPDIQAIYRQDTLPDPSQFTETNMNRMLTYMDSVQSQYIATASKILSSSQMRQFQTFAAQQREMNAMGIKFAAQMIGGGPSNVSSAVVNAPTSTP